MTRTVRETTFKLLLPRGALAVMTLAWVVLLTLCFHRQAKAEEIERGVIIDKQVCQRDAAESYALYLPSNYTAEKKWPILYAFDPIARGRLPVERFREAAEKYGYIIAGSNNSKNGPVRGSLEAMDAVWRDTHARFTLDDNRVYATGFSGGARVASLAATACGNCVAGVIACGAGFNSAYPPSKQTSFAVFAAVGVDDFNYPELAALDQTLEKYSIPHRLAVFEGSHAWPPPDVCMEAIEWMEVQAVRSGRKPRDESFVHELFERSVKRARLLEEQRNLYEAYGLYQSLAASYKELLDVKELERKAAELRASKDVKERVKEEKSQIERQRVAASELVRLARLLSNPDERANALGDLRRLVAELRKKAESSEDTGERRVARRALRQTYAQFYETATIEYARAPQAASAQLEIAAEIAPRDISVFYQLAILYAQAGDKRRALESLRRAVENGLKDPALIEGNRDLSRLREEAAYRRIIAALKSN
jgi:dienelactone hydrolase